MACERRPYAGGLLAAVLLLLSAMAQAAPTVALTTSNATPVVGGALFAYTITVNNPDAVTANNLSVSLPLPPSLLFQGVAIAGTGSGGFSCTHPGLGQNGLLLCRAPSMAASTTATFTVATQVDQTVASGVRTATARLVVGTTATTASVQINLQVSAPLTVSITGPGSAARGERVSYLLTVSNSGSSTTINTTLSATLPVGFSHFSAQGTGALANVCDYTAATRTLSCPGADLPVGTTRLTWTAEIAPNAALGAAQVSFAIGNAGTGTIVVGSSSVNTIVN